MKVQDCIESLNNICTDCGKYGSLACALCLVESMRQVTILEAMHALNKVNVQC